MRLLRIACLSLLLLPVALRAEEPVLLASVKPLAWLVAAIAPPGSRVEVLVPDGQSPHDYQLRPADAVRLARSALAVWVGPGLEPWLVQAAGRLPASRQLPLLPLSLHEHDHHGDADADHLADTANDPHLWLDPQAMAAQAQPLAERLKAVYPAQAGVIDSRAAQFREAMAALDTALAAQLAPVASQGFVVYHDGYQRLVQRYHLSQRAAVWRHESVPAGARERAALLALLQHGDAQCLFYEPEHGADAVRGWLGSAAGNVRLVELDVLGGHVAPGDDAYPRFLRGLAGQMVACLADQSRAAYPLHKPDKP